MKSANLRIHDLIAKTAHVTLKDTLRVILSMQVVAKHLNCTLEEIAELSFDLSKATPEQAESCTAEFNMLRKHLKESNREYEILKIRSLD